MIKPYGEFEALTESTRSYWAALTDFRSSEGADQLMGEKLDEYSATALNALALLPNSRSVGHLLPGLIRNLCGGGATERMLARRVIRDFPPGETEALLMEILDDLVDGFEVDDLAPLIWLLIEFGMAEPFTMVMAHVSKRVDPSVEGFLSDYANVESDPSRWRRRKSDWGRIAETGTSG